MAIRERDLSRRDLAPEVDELEALWRRPATDERRIRRAPRPPDVSTRWAAKGALVWLLLTAAVFAVEPTPTAAQLAEPIPVWAGLGVGAWLWLTLAGLAALAVGRRWGFTAGIVAGSVGMLLSLSCPLTGHHDWAAWQVAQMAAHGAVVTLGVLGRRRG